MKTIIIVICISFLGLGAQDFARFGSDLGSTGQYADTLLKPPLKLKWRSFTEGTFKGSPIVSNGRIFCTDRQGQIYCVDAESGRLIWKRLYLGLESMIPLASGDYLYYLETGTGYYDRTGYFRCVRQDNGEDVWVKPNVGGKLYKTGKFSPQAFKGNIYFFGTNGETGNSATLYCFNALTGDTVWTRTFGPLSDAVGLIPSNVLVCTLTVKPVIISAYASGAQENWRDKYGLAFALTADSGKTVWETDVYHSVDCIYDTVLYGYTTATTLHGLFAASVFTGDTIYAKQGETSYKNSATDKYLFSRGYASDVRFFNRSTGTIIGGCDFSAIPIPPGGRVLSGCGFVTLANGYGYCGFGQGGYSDSTYNPPGGSPRSGLGQGLYAFEIPSGPEVTNLKVVWYYKMASNMCTTPAVWNGKLYLTTNNEGAIYCFESAQ